MKTKFITLFISTFAVMLGVGIIAPLMPLYAESMGATGIWLGIIFAGYSLSSLIFTPFMGKISDKRGRKKFICIGLFLYTFLSIGYVFADNVYMLTWVRFLHGFASAMVMPLVMAYVGDIAPRGKEGKFMGYLNVSIFLGMGLGPFIGGVLNDSLGIVYVFYAMCALSAIALAVTLIFLTEETTSMIRHSEKEKKEYASFKSLLKNDIIKGLFAFRFITAVGSGSIMAFLPLYAYSLGMSPTEIGLIITLNILCMSVMQVPFGKLADRHSKIKLMIAGGILSGISLLLIPFATDFNSMLLINIFAGFGGAIGMPAATAINAIMGRRYGMGTTMGLFTTAMSLGMFIAPLMAGVIMDTINLSAIFYFGSFFTFLGIVVFYRFTGSYEKEISGK